MRISGLLPLLCASALVAAGQASAQEEARPHISKADHPGRAIFERQCASCHGAGPGDDGMPMLPGTMALAAKYQGKLPGALEVRTNLNADVIRFFVRNGSGSMPMFRISELSDADIEAIAQYLGATAEASAQE